MHLRRCGAPHLLLNWVVHVSSSCGYESCSILFSKSLQVVRCACFSCGYDLSQSTVPSIICLSMIWTCIVSGARKPTGLNKLFTRDKTPRHVLGFRSSDTTKKKVSVFHPNVTLNFWTGLVKVHLSPILLGFLPRCQVEKITLPLFLFEITLCKIRPLFWKTKL